MPDVMWRVDYLRMVPPNQENIRGGDKKIKVMIMIVGVVKTLFIIIIIAKMVDSHYFGDVAYCDTYVLLML